MLCLTWTNKSMQFFFLLFLCCCCSFAFFPVVDSFFFFHCNLFSQFRNKPPLYESTQNHFSFNCYSSSKNAMNNVLDSRQLTQFRDFDWIHAATTSKWLSFTQFSHNRIKSLIGILVRNIYKIMWTIFISSSRELQ